MVLKRARVGLGLGLLLVMAAMGNAVAAPSVLDVRLGLHPDKTRFVLEVSEGITWRTQLLTDPNRMVVDLPDVALNAAPAGGRGLGIIRRWTAQSSPETGQTQLVLELTRPARLRQAVMMTPSEGHQRRLVLDIEQAPAGAPVRAETVRAPPVASAPPPPAPAFKPPPPLPVADAAAAAAAAAVPSPSLPGPAVASAMAEAAPAVLPTSLIPLAGGPPPPPPAAALPGSPVSLSPSLPPPPVQVAAAAGPLPLAPPPPPPPPPRAPQRRTVVLDPGHGGQDPGTTGINGVFEKVITLGVARELRQQLEATGRYRVELTRDSDEFIRLRDRVAIARHAGADLFISLHADSIARTDIRGMSIYTLSDKATDREAEMLAAKENRADAIGGVDLTTKDDEVATILIDLAQRDTRNRSRRFAALVLRELGREFKLLHKPNRSAGFAVLTAADTPSALLEMGYLSSSGDVAVLNTPALRQKLAMMLVRAIERYFATQPGGNRS